MNLFLIILKRDLLIAYRNFMELLNPLLFFILVTLLFPLAITSDPQKLMSIAAGIIWVALLFAIMFSIEGMFQMDFEDGTLEQIALHSQSLTVSVLGKLLAHWIITALPLLAISGIMSQLFFLPKQAIIVLFLSLLLGSPVLTIIGAIGAALTLGLRNRSIVLVLLVLPLYLPVLIFGTSAVMDASYGLSVQAQLAFLTAFLTLAITFAPLAIACALRISLE